MDKTQWFKKTFLIGMSMAMLAPQLGHAFGETQIRTFATQANPVKLLKPGWANFFLHQSSLNSFYETRGYSAVWVDSNGRPNSAAQALRAALKEAHLQGLNPAEYWDSTMEGMMTAQNIASAWITFELAATEALIRYVSHLSNGRFEPKELDDDIKFTQRKFTKFAQLNAAVSSGDIKNNLNSFAPKHDMYKRLLSLLQELHARKEMGGWQKISSDKKLTQGVSDPSIAQIRSRLQEMGYEVSQGSNSFDSELLEVIKKFQADSTMQVDGVIGSQVINSLNKSVNDRIQLVELNLEKLRWLPETLESRYAFVNLATTNFTLMDQGKKAFDFKTINGQVFRRTPSMRDVMHFVELNPTWTVPHSIATRDKLNRIKADPGYVAKSDMKLYDSNTDREVNPQAVNWANYSKTNFPFYLVQQPGYRNALGVVKFPLTNGWAIYLHGTDDYSLFERGNRLISSGCVRLENPLEFAEYILRDNVKVENLKYGNNRDPNWPLSKIMSVVPQGDGQKPDPGHLRRRIEMTKPVPVYMLYLTAVKHEDGRVQFVEDLYGSDYRLNQALKDNRIGKELF